MTGLVDNFHLIVKEQELKQTEELLDHHRLEAMLTGNATGDRPVDDQLFVLLLKSYFYNHSRLKLREENKKMRSEMYLQKAQDFLEQNDSHFIIKDDDDYSIVSAENGVLNRLAPPIQETRESRQSLSPARSIHLGQDFLDNERDSVASHKFPTYNVNPLYHCELNLTLAITWIEATSY